MKTALAIVGGVLAVILVAVLAYGSWQLGWFVNKANTNKQSEIYNDSFQRQNALASEAAKEVSDVTTIDVQLTQTSDPTAAGMLTAQRKALVSQACNTIGKLSGTVTVPDSVNQFKAKECS